MDNDNDSHHHHDIADHHRYTPIRQQMMILTATPPPSDSYRQPRRWPKPFNKQCHPHSLTTDVRPMAWQQWWPPHLHHHQWRPAKDHTETTPPPYATTDGHHTQYSDNDDNHYGTDSDEISANDTDFQCIYFPQWNIFSSFGTEPLLWGFIHGHWSCCILCSVVSYVLCYEFQISDAVVTVSVWRSGPRTDEGPRTRPDQTDLGPDRSPGPAQDHTASILVLTFWAGIKDWSWTSLDRSFWHIWGGIILTVK